ncbi:MAG: Gfo/Idh/MocA family oxidoreductase [Candidatus Poribacteria bacterium]|nr:Gfo/Idh/MocA family oxidoreductase [Candidatus Poribacteria bacterium]
MALRVAVIGMRGIGNTHAGVYHESELAELVAVCDFVKERADESAQKFGAKAYYSIDDLLDNEKLDAVSVATGGFENGGDHFEPTMQALEAGLHVLCEKPLSNDVARAREMVNKAKEKGVCLGTNLNHRFTPLAIQAKEWVTSGKLGDLLFINMALWIENPNETSPFFHLRALHPHSLDVMMYFCGTVEKVHAFAMRAPGRRNWSNASINLQFKNGAIGHLSGSYDAGRLNERCEVAGTNGQFLLDGVFEKLTLYPRHGGDIEVYHNPPPGAEGHMDSFGDTFKTRISAWMQQLVNGDAPDEIDASGAAGLAAQEIIEGAIKSFQTDTVVTLS